MPPSKLSFHIFSNTALHVAAENNLIECAELLLQAGALVDALRGEAARETALHLAANNGYGEMVKLLLGNRYTLKSCMSRVDWV